MADQTGGCLHTMASLQAYQNDLLRDLDKDEEVLHNAIKELCWGIDLSLRATKEMAHSILALVGYLQLNLSGIMEKDKHFL